MDDILSIKKFIDGLILPYRILFLYYYLNFFKERACRPRGLPTVKKTATLRSVFSRKAGAKVSTYSRTNKFIRPFS